MSTEVKSPADEDVNDTSRMLNLGIPIKLKLLGEVTVRELSLESLLALSDKIVASFKFFIDAKDEGDDSDNVAYMMQLLKSPEVLIAAKAIAAASTDKLQIDFDNMGISDWFLVLKAIKEVTNWEEMRDLFMELVPKDVASKLQVSSQLTESPQ